jgi:2-oxoisovalerate dehydrogenase E1 component
MGVHWAMELKKTENLDIEIIDLVSLAPIDYPAIQESVIKTGKVLLLTEDTLTGALISDLAAWISENLFNNLDAPVMRVGSLDTPIPFNKTLEDNFLAKQQLNTKIKLLLQY